MAWFCNFTSEGQLLWWPTCHPDQSLFIVCSANIFSLLLSGALQYKPCLTRPQTINHCKNSFEGSWNTNGVGKFKRITVIDVQPSTGFTAGTVYVPGSRLMCLVYLKLLRSECKFCAVNVFNLKATAATHGMNLSLSIPRWSLVTVYFWPKHIAFLLLLSASFHIHNMKMELNRIGWVPVPLYVML